MTADSLIHGKRRKQVAALLIQHGRELLFASSTSCFVYARASGERTHQRSCEVIRKMRVHACGRRVGSRRSKLMQWRRIVRMSILALARLAAVDYRVNSPLIFRLCLVVVGGISVGVIECPAPVIARELSVP
jgi:hypothetical protein